MSETRKLNEGAVTALPDNGIVMAADASGRYSPITVSAFLDAVRSSISVGGRNLLTGTASPFVMAKFPNETRIYRLATLLSREEAGTQVTLSFRYEYSDVAATSGARLGIQVALKQMTGYQIYAECIHTDIRESASGEGRQVRTVTLPEGMDIDSYNVSVFSQGVERGNVRIFDIKIERGNVGTDWSPAPEDLLGG